MLECACRSGTRPAEPEAESLPFCGNRREAGFLRTLITAQKEIGSYTETMYRSQEDPSGGGCPNT